MGDCFDAVTYVGVGTTFFGGHAVQAAENDTVKVNEQQAYSQAPQSELRVPTVEEAPSSAAPQSTATSGAQQSQAAASIAASAPVSQASTDSQPSMTSQAQPSQTAASPVAASQPVASEQPSTTAAATKAPDLTTIIDSLTAAQSDNLDAYNNYQVIETLSSGDRSNATLAGYLSQAAAAAIAADSNYSVASTAAGSVASLSETAANYASEFAQGSNAVNSATAAVKSNAVLASGYAAAATSAATAAGKNGTAEELTQYAKMRVQPLRQLQLQQLRSKTRSVQPLQNIMQLFQPFRRRQQVIRKLLLQELRQTWHS